MQALDPQLADLRSWSLAQGRTNRGDRRVATGAGYHHVRGIGGSTLHFVGEAHRMNPAAMKMKSRFGVAADWPVSYAELEPLYLEIERLLGVAGPAEAGDRWRSAPYPFAAHPLSRASRRLARGAAALKIGWQPNPRAALPVAFDGRPPCNYCGGCTHGCPRRDKGSADVTFIAKARASGRCEIRAEHTLLRIVSGADRRVEAIEIADALEAGAAHRHAAPGAGLRRGRDAAAAAVAARPGRAAGRPQLPRERRLDQHRRCRRAAAQLRRPAGRCDQLGQNRPDAIPGVVGGFRLSAAIHEADMMGPIAHAQRAVPGWGRAHKEKMRRTVGSLIAVGAVGESLPHDGSMIDLDPKEKDGFGRPLARIHSVVDAMNVKRLRAMAAAARGLLKASGAATLVEEYGTYDSFSSAHVFGSCRMGPTRAARWSTRACACTACRTCGSATPACSELGRRRGAVAHHPGAGPACGRPDDLR
jgi:choline dehydrogenase-like flavoprotein